MKNVTTSNFGLLIAYLLPGFTALWGLSFVSPTLRSWLAATPADVPTVGGFLYVTLGSVAAGLTVSTVRWAVIDTIHHHTGICRPNWDFARLQENVTAFDVLVEIHYRYYQFYANSLVSLTLVCAARWQSLGLWSGLLSWYTPSFLLLGCIFFVASRDTLRKYYDRVGHLLGLDEPIEPAGQSDAVLLHRFARSCYSKPALDRNSESFMPYSRHSSASSTTSTRRSPVSTLDKNEA